MFLTLSAYNELCALKDNGVNDEFAIYLLLHSYEGVFTKFKVKSSPAMSSWSQHLLYLQTKNIFSVTENKVKHIMKRA